MQIILEFITIWLSISIVTLATIWYMVTIIKPRYHEWWERYIVSDDPEWKS